MTTPLCAPEVRPTRQQALDFFAEFDLDLTVDDLATFEMAGHEFTALQIIERQAQLGF